MSDFFKNKYKVVALLLSTMIIITVASVVFTQGYFFGDKKNGETESSENSGETPPEGDNPTDNTFEDPVVFRVPDPMRGIYLSAGVEFFTSSSDDEATVKSQIDKALDDAYGFTFNTLIINPKTEDGVVYTTPASHSVSSDWDMMEYLVQRGKEEGFFVFSLFDVSDYRTTDPTIALSLNKGGYNQLSDNIGIFAKKYELDGIILDGYQNETTESSYGVYSQLGGAIGFDNYMRQDPDFLINTSVQSIRSSMPSTLVGLLADPVWDNLGSNEEGSNTTATYTALNSGNVDTRGLAENGVVDFMMVNAYGAISDPNISFGEVAKWWASLALKSELPVYVIQASSLSGSSQSGWAAPEELMKQTALLDETTGIRGNCFDSLKVLNANPGGATDSLMKYYIDEIEPELILTQLEVTRPAQTTYSTNENQVVFAGASDPTEKVSINDKEIPTDQSGYFTVTFELAAGVNNFVITHKEKTLEYSITRQVDILTEVTPAGSITVDGGMEVSISAIAYEGSKVTAYVSGQAIELVLDENVVDESDRASTYKRYSGVYKAPAATTSVQTIENIAVTASWQDEQKTLQGASISINKKAQIEDGVPIIVTTDQAKTYPANTLDNIPRSSTYPLPKGALDYAVGQEIEYKGVAYTVLSSGLRVKSEDISPTSDFADGNAISGLSLSVKDGFTYITLSTAQTVSYNFAYDGNAVSIAFNNTNSTPNSANLDSNPLFASADWSGSTLTLPLVRQGGFMGFKGYYDGGKLVFRFNNPPSSISSARIVIDPGHGGKDVGALGFLSNYHESTINWLIANETADQLRARGAKVLLLDTRNGMDLPTRIAQAESFNADLLISIHNNTAPNSAAKGTEVYYFYQFSQTLAKGASAAVSSQVGTTNRGARQSYYIITLSSQFPSVLVECGFMSNKDEYEKLIRTKYHERIALGIADGVESAISASYTGIDGGVTTVVEDESSTITSSNTESSTQSSTEQSSASSSDKITLNQSKLTLAEGKTATITATVTPSTAKQTVTWTSSNADVASVSSGGMVTAIKSGNATITATSSSGKRANCTIFVEKEASSSSSSSSSSSTSSGTAGVRVDEVFFSDYTLSIGVGKTYQMDYEVFPTTAANKTLTWKSSDEKVATVNSAGLIAAVAQGTTNITATTNDGSSITETCALTVTTTDTGGSTSGDSSMLKDANYIELFNANGTMYVGTSQTLSVRTDKGVTVPNSVLTWSSSNTSVATVSSAGVVTSKRTEGSTTIDVHDKDDYLFDTFKITVTKSYVAVEKMTLNQTTLTIPVGTTYKDLKAVLTPSNATTSSLSWRSTKESVATVDSNGVVTGKSAGTTTIIVKTGNIQANCTVTVTDKMIIDELYLDTDGFEMQVGTTDYLTATVEPSSIKPNFVWTSSRPSIVEVDSKGNLTAVAVGTSTITVTIEGNTSFKATCTITVV